jgi:hypothetical protein
MQRISTREELIVKFWSKAKKNEQTDCLEWIGSLNRKGYGQVNSLKNFHSKASHRVAWEITNGLPPEGLLVLHKCDNPCCVNPDHLFIGTAKDNTADMYAKGRERNLSGQEHQYFGKKRPQHVCEAIRVANLGKKHTQETKDRMSKSHIVLVQTEEHKKKVSIALTGRTLSEQHKQNLRKPHRVHISA